MEEGDPVRPPEVHFSRARVPRVGPLVEFIPLQPVVVAIAPE